MGGMRIPIPQVPPPQNEARTLGVAQTLLFLGGAQGAFAARTLFFLTTTGFWPRRMALARRRAAWRGQKWG